MNTIGIDYQQTLTVVCLGEGRGGSARVRNVGDGLRPVIPNAVHGEELWGSRALAAGASIPEPEDGPWLAEPDASRFWLRLYQRLYAFLGRIAPTSQQGYRVVAGLQASNWRAAIEGVERLCTQAGFAAPACITATDALLARLLSEQRQMAAGDSTVTVVAAGDTATTVCSYRIRQEGRSMPRLLARDTTPRSLPFGQAHWAGRLLVNVTDLITESTNSGFDLAMRDSALEFGSRLRRAPAGRAVTWTGPLRDKLYAPLELTVADCSAWPEASPLMQRLPDMIRDSAAALGGRGRPDLILVGGIGALWPFALQAAATVGPVQQSGSPEEDVARGAAWWPEVEALWSDVLPIEASSALNTPLPDWLSDMPAGISTEAAVVTEETEDYLQEPDDNPFLFGAGRDEPFAPAVGQQTLTGDSFTPAVEPPFLRGEPVAPRSDPTLPPPLPMEPVREVRLSPFEPPAENENVRVPPLLNTGTTSEYDLPAPPSKAGGEEEVVLEDLPPWDPRRNEL